MEKWLIIAIIWASSALLSRFILCNADVARRRHNSELPNWILNRNKFIQLAPWIGGPGILPFAFIAGIEYFYYSMKKK